MRNAINLYKDAADMNLVRVKVGSRRLPAGPGNPRQGRSPLAVGDLTKEKKVLAPHPHRSHNMTGRAEWGFRGVQDDPDSTSWNGENVFDVFSKSQGTALDGTKYSDW